MEAGIENNLLNTAKNKAKSIIEAYSYNDKIYFIDNRFLGPHQRSLGKEKSHSACY